jgi:rhodanese-related sulfurtransferase
MATASLSFSDFLNIGRLVRRSLEAETILIANIEDFGIQEAVALKEAGFNGVYHAVRLGEGKDTRISMQKRLETIAAVHKAGLKLGTCVEPVGPLWGTTLDKEELTKKLESYGVTNNTLVVFTSNVLPGPGSDGRNVWQLRMAGLDNVKVLYGGNPYWKELGYEMTKEASPTPTPVAGLTLKDFDESYSADKDYVAANIAIRSVC